MFVYGGTVRETTAVLEAAPTAFVDACSKSFSRLYGKPPGAAERSSWEKSWPELLRALMQAGLGELRLFLEYELPGSGQRVDALLLGLARTAG
ncbi:hypothetical protein DFR72_111203 [Lentzea flaviverrucosa]|uniref:Uncharacterized protein n=2 Tax=Lentzea flaviverrucosa TaxID=200379 RepID=A0A1H9WTG6_9PSEU|nr:hypothetical protein DFR72_111203 [Lentzea flaviverrucosa]SES36977.1 hypothetical protein SAMN05216195_112197 [Lentzea flaviverrucosa]